MLTGAILPHAPLLLDLPGREHPCPSMVAAARSVPMDDADLVVVCSPHGKRSGIYTEVKGDLGGFGLSGFQLDLRTDADAVEALSGYWGRPLLEEPVDHGVVVPLLLAEIPPEVPVVAVCMEGWTGQTSREPAPAIKDAHDLAEALGRLGGDRKIRFVASAHGSASATPRAPLLERSAGRELDRALVSALTRDPSAIDEIADDLWERSGACGAGPLVALSMLVNGRASLLAYGAPFGVSYVVADFR